MISEDWAHRNVLCQCYSSVAESRSSSWIQEEKYTKKKYTKKSTVTMGRESSLYANSVGLAET